VSKEIKSECVEQVSLLLVQKEMVTTKEAHLKWATGLLVPSLNVLT
jgi:hypothetical protein